MNLGGATAPQYELVGTQKESKGLLLGTQLHAFGEAATERDVCPFPHTVPCMPWMLRTDCSAYAHSIFPLANTELMSFQALPHLLLGQDVVTCSDAAHSILHTGLLL